MREGLPHRAEGRDGSVSRCVDWAWLARRTPWPPLAMWGNLCLRPRMAARRHAGCVIAAGKHASRSRGLAGGRCPVLPGTARSGRVPETDSCLRLPVNPAGGLGGRSPAVGPARSHGPQATPSFSSSSPWDGGSLIAVLASRLSVGPKRGFPNLPSCSRRKSCSRRARWGFGSLCRGQTSVLTLGRPRCPLFKTTL